MAVAVGRAKIGENDRKKMPDAEMKAPRARYIVVICH